MQLLSPAFADGQPIPTKYTSQGAGVSPPLQITDIPDGVQSLVLTLDDPDAPQHRFTHWLVWNIEPNDTVFPEDDIPQNAAQGFNDKNQLGYTAPAPPSGTHHYVFTVYALNDILAVPANTAETALEHIMQGHVMAKAKLTGTVSADAVAVQHDGTPQPDAAGADNPQPSIASQLVPPSGDNTQPQGPQIIQPQSGQTPAEPAQQPPSHDGTLNIQH